MELAHFDFVHDLIASPPAQNVGPLPQLIHLHVLDCDQGSGRQPAPQPRRPIRRAPPKKPRVIQMIIFIYHCNRTL
ncbi:hypothetical protein EBZ39_11545 [bacterium]|nr:hypothetical protein [bacterium]